MERPAILLLGSGAMALLFGARLGMAGYPVTLLGHWHAGIEAVRTRGIRLFTPDGQLQQVTVDAVTTPEAVRGTRLALVLVKSWQTERAAQDLARCLAEDGLAVTLQNGLGNRQILAHWLGAERVTQGVTTYGATLLGPGEVRLGGVGKIALAEHPRLAPLFQALQEAGFQVELSADLSGLIWGKLVINAAINPLTALLDVPNGVLLTSPAARALMAALAEETAAVARTLGVTLPFSNAAEAAAEVARQTAANLSSMLQDLRRGAPTEITAICGAVVQQAQALGISAPLNWTMWQLVQARLQIPSPQSLPAESYASHRA